MDQAQVFIFDLGWFFFAAWSLLLAAVSIVAFGRDLLGLTETRASKNQDPGSNV